MPEIGVGVVENKAEGKADAEGKVEEHGVVEAHDVVDIEYDDAIGAIEVSASWDL